MKLLEDICMIKIYFSIPSRLNSGMKSDMLAPSSCIKSINYANI